MEHGRFVAPLPKVSIAKSSRPILRCIPVVRPCRRGEMADAIDSKSVARKGVGVRVPPPAPLSENREKSRFFRIQAPSRAETNDTGNHLPVDLRRQLPTPHEANRPWNREGRSIHRRRARRTGPRNPRAIWVAPDPSAPFRPASRPPVHGAPGGLPRQAVPPGIGDGSHSNRPNSPHTACRCDE